MKIIYYLMGVLFLFYLFSIYYEDKREKDFLKRDLELSEKELVEINTSTLNKDKAISYLDSGFCLVLQNFPKYLELILLQSSNTSSSFCSFIYVINTAECYIICISRVSCAESFC